MPRKLHRSSVGVSRGHSINNYSFLSGLLYNIRYTIKSQGGGQNKYTTDED